MVLISVESWTFGAGAFVALFAPIAVFLTTNNYPLLSIETGGLLLLCTAGGLLIQKFVQYKHNIISRTALCGIVAMSISVLAQTDNWVILLAIGIGCIICFLILREHINLIVLVAFSGHIVATLVLSLSTNIQEIRTEHFPHHTDHKIKNLPPILHIVLDEHIGIHGLPTNLPRATNLSENLKKFYQRESFHLYSRAYSQYFETSQSLSNLFNFASSNEADAYATVRAPKDLNKTNLPYYYNLDASKYFEHLNRLGYRLNIYQSDFLDFCRVPDIEYASCKTYRSNSIISILNTELAVIERFKFVANSFAESSAFLKWIRWVYNRKFRILTSPHLPIWKPGVSRTGPLPALRMLKLLNAELGKAKPGNVYFAHLLLPHYPYNLRSDCKLRPQLSDWLNRSATEDPSEPLIENTSTTRSQRYNRYIDQIECQQILLSNLLKSINNNSVWNDSTVIIHGDHGSRIALHKPELKIESEPTTEGHIDYFSTLFAVRFGSHSTGKYIESPHNLQTLLARAFGIPVKTSPN